MAQRILSIGAFVLFVFGFQFPAQAKTQAGLSLLEAPTARAAALNGALTAGQNDVAAFAFNPASLSSLQKNQATFLLQNGINDDAYGQFSVGIPSQKSGLGFSVGYYDGGDLLVSDGFTLKNVASQKDLVVRLGLSRSIHSFSFGMAGTYLSSTLAEQDQATAVAGDFGVGYKMNSRINLGAAIQNIGTKIRFDSAGDELPRIARWGGEISVHPYNIATKLFLDAAYHMNPGEWRPALGVETKVGPLAFRMGYKTGRNAEELSVGTGFLIGQTGFDYSFGLVNQLESQHRVSVGFEFGSTPHSEYILPESLELNGNSEINFPVSGDGNE